MPAPNESHAARNAELRALIRPIATATYGVDCDWHAIDYMLDGYAKHYGLNLSPDFQRGHVWTAQQQSHFIENILRGVVTPAGLSVQLNCPHWEDDDYAGPLPREMQIIDGLQRLTAVRAFLAGQVRAFGLLADDFRRSAFDPRRFCYRLRFEVHTFQRPAELLQHYLDLNAGGTPHTTEELDRVRSLLAAAKTAPTEQVPA